MTDFFKIGIIQFDIKQNEVDANLAELEELFYAEIVGKSFDMIVLPEMFTAGFGPNSSRNAEFMNGKSHKWMQNMATISGGLVIGSLPIRENSKVYNRLMVVSPEKSNFIYNKRHLFTYSGENDEYEQGDTIGQFTYKGVVIRPIVCYDLRFPVWCRNTAKEPYDVLVCVANWPASRKNAWNTLTKARAIENQSYVIASNRVGNDALDIIYEGDSDVIDFKGDSIVEPTVKGSYILTASISISALKAFRSKFPFLNDGDNFSIH